MGNKSTRSNPFLHIFYLAHYVHNFVHKIYIGITFVRKRTRENSFLNILLPSWIYVLNFVHIINHYVQNVAIEITMDCVLKNLITNRLLNYFFVCSYIKYMCTSTLYIYQHWRYGFDSGLHHLNTWKERTLSLELLSTHNNKSKKINYNDHRTDESQNGRISNVGLVNWLN